jgi:uncharacterized protein YcbK (DUF882 family)
VACYRGRSLVWLVSVALATGHALRADAFDSKTVPFTVSIDGETAPYREMSTFLMPGATTTLEVVNGPTGKYELTAKDGTAIQRAARRWRYSAPQRPGLYTLKLDGPGHNDTMDLHVFVLVPASQVKGGWLNGYQIGQYPPASARYTPPKGFVEVTKDNEDTKLTPHFTLQQFVCKQETPTEYPKYVVLDDRLLLKLEAILERVNALGFSTDTLHVMSGYRTPYYNHAIGDVKYSQHQWGSAADVYIDPHDKNRMEDLNRDGHVDVADARFLYDRIEEWFAGKAGQKLEGGLGFYPATAAHPPFVHVDVRGTKARWKG